MKIFHFHLEDGYQNKSTLTCRLEEGSIKYRYFSGTASHGIPLSLSNLQIGYKFGNKLPMDNKTKMTKDDFARHVKGIINTDSVYRVVNEVETEVTFE